MTEYPRRHLGDREVHRRWMDPRLRSLRLADVHAYLQRNGWKRMPTREGQEAVYQEPGCAKGDELYQWLPASEQQRDYLQRVYELLAGIAEVEDRTAGEVLSEMLPQRGALPDDGTRGILPVEAGAR